VSDGCPQFAKRPNRNAQVLRGIGDCSYLYQIRFVRLLRAKNHQQQHHCCVGGNLQICERRVLSSARAPGRGTGGAPPAVGAGGPLLRLPCEHTFHASCRSQPRPGQLLREGGTGTHWDSCHSLAIPLHRVHTGLLLCPGKSMSFVDDAGSDLSLKLTPHVSLLSSADQEDSAPATVGYPLCLSPFLGVSLLSCADGAHSEPAGAAGDAHRGVSAEEAGRAGRVPPSWTPGTATGRRAGGGRGPPWKRSALWCGRNVVDCVCVFLRECMNEDLGKGAGNVVDCVCGFRER